MSINFNPELLEEAKQLGQHRTKQAAINAALMEYIAKQKRLAVIKAFGSFDFEENYDYKKRAASQMIFVDTSVWSLAFRRKQEQADIPVINQLKALIEKDELLAVPGIVLQELLTGLKEESQFNRMYKLITGFSIIMTNEAHHKLAAQTANKCRKNGVATTATDCLIAAMAISYSAQLLTTDNDFTYMSNYCDLKIYPTGLVLKNN